MGTRVGFGSRRDLLYTSLTAAWKSFEFEFHRAAFGPPYLFSRAFEGWGGRQRLS